MCVCSYCRYLHDSMNMRYVLMILSASVCGGNFVYPTKGEVWPQTQGQKHTNIYYVLIPSDFRFKIINKNCQILEDALTRYTKMIKELYQIVEKHLKFDAEDIDDSPDYHGEIAEIKLNLTQPCDEYPYFKMDESYSVTISSSSIINSNSIWGMLRGMETVSQLFYISDGYSEVRINSTEIFDFPYYLHRGLLVDTARHYLPLPELLLVLDAMAANKMNVFHWHIVDDQSFPYKSEKFPELSEKGAFHPSLVYTKEDIKKLVNYARDRGIRVVPEFDVPGHSQSWGKAYPAILTQCYVQKPNGLRTPGLGPMHPLKKNTYKILVDLFSELREIFPDKYMHIGGDEVDTFCWASNPELQKFILEYNITNPGELLAVFTHKLMHLMENKFIPIMWEEVYLSGARLPKDALLQVWNIQDYHKLLFILADNISVIYSSEWYLDRTTKTVEDFYKSDPRELLRNMIEDESSLNFIVGGEACMWSETTDENNIHSKIWPKASAVAEVLWSATMGTVPKNMPNRLQEHSCRLIRRGIPVSPHMPGFCIK